MKKIIIALSVALALVTGCKQVTGVNVSWGDIDVRYQQDIFPELELNEELELSGWRGERVFAQAVVWTETPVMNFNFEVTDLFQQRNWLRRVGEGASSRFGCGR